LKQAASKILSKLKPVYQERYGEIYRMHQAGGGGSDVVQALSDLADQMLLKAFESVDPWFAQDWGGSLIAIGGYGRRELSPGSDIDLMFLYPDGRGHKAESAVSELLCLLWDLGYKVGHSTRTLEEALDLARGDALIATSLLEARFLHGDRSLFKRFHEGFFSKVVDRNIKAFLKHLEAERAMQRESCGGTPYLLEPNIKQSPGGLRDIHTLKWFAAARHRAHALAQVHQWGHLSPLDYERLAEAQDFLWRIRNQLHFLSGKGSDQLTIELQEDIASFFGLKDRRGLMRNYYLRAGAVLEISSRFIRETFPLARGHQWRRSWRTRQVAPGFLLFSGEISIRSETPFQFFDVDENLMRLFLLAKAHAARISDSVLEVVQQISQKKQGAPLSPGALVLFKTLMMEPGGIAESLRLMHRLHFLWRIIPAFSEINCLVQESRSHAFTVDEHSFRAIEAAEQMRFQEGEIQRIYASVQRKDLLHLAILLHDIGKGRTQNHSQRGAKIADTLAERLGYAEDDRRLLVFLVAQHLILSEVAFYRDVEDEPVLRHFMAKVGRIEVLRKLFILTCADIRATAPGMWTDWKGALLLKLYREAFRRLSGARPPGKTEVSELRESLRQALERSYPEAWLEETLSNLSPRYLLLTQREKVKQDLSALARLQEYPIQLVSRPLGDEGLSEYNLYTYDWITSGIFASMAGVLTAKGLKILAAQVFTHPNGMVIDAFQVRDPQSGAEKEMDEARISGICEDLKQVLSGQTSVEAVFERNRRFSPQDKRLPLKEALEIEIDNHSSHTFTVIDITASDQKGLLYVIAKTLLEMGIAVQAAKIATRLDQAADIFYVLGPNQKKLVSKEDQARLKAQLSKQIRAQLQSGGLSGLR